MALETKNIIVGAARIFLGKTENSVASLPTEDTTKSFATILQTTGSSTWDEVGLTSEGLEVAFEPEYLDVEVDQLLDSAGLFKMRMRVTVRTSFTEATLANLAKALGQKTSGTGNTLIGNDLKLPGGSLGEFPVERSFAAVGNGPRNDTLTASNTKTPERVYYARRAISVEAVTHSLKRDAATVYPVAFRLLPDTTYTGSEYGLIRDRAWA
jgi:hypothetical protein